MYTTDMKVRFRKQTHLTELDMFTTLSVVYSYLNCFLQAIIQSDPFTAEYKPVTQSLKNGEEFAKALGK